MNGLKKANIGLNRKVLADLAVTAYIEVANMPTTNDALKFLMEQPGMIVAPSKAVNAGGVLVSGLEMSQNSERYSWTAEEVDEKLHRIMISIHDESAKAAEEVGLGYNLVAGANIAVGHEALIEGDGQLRFCRAGEAGAAGGGIGIEGKLGDHKDAAAHLLKAAVHLAVFIFKDPEVADLVCQLHGYLLRVVGADAQQHQKALTDLTVHVSVDGDAGAGNTGNDCFHGTISFLSFIRQVL